MNKVVTRDGNLRRLTTATLRPGAWGVGAMVAAPLGVGAWLAVATVILIWWLLVAALVFLIVTVVLALIALVVVGTVVLTLVGAVQAIRRQIRTDRAMMVPTEPTQEER